MQSIFNILRSINKLYDILSQKKHIDLEGKAHFICKKLYNIIKLQLHEGKKDFI